MILINNAKERERFLKFAVVGVIGAVIDFGVMNLLTQVGSMQLVPAGTISFICAVISNFIWNRFWTYPDSRSDLPATGHVFCGQHRRGRHPNPHPAFRRAAHAAIDGQHECAGPLHSRNPGQEPHPGAGGRDCNALEFLREPLLDV